MVSAINPKVPVAPSGGGPHNPDMEARVAKLEAHVEHILNDIIEIKDDLRSFRAEVSSEFRNFRSNVNDEFRSLRSEYSRDFRLTFAALISVALGLAAMMAKGFHWL